MQDEVPGPVAEAIATFNEQAHTTLSDYVKPQPDEIECYAIGAVAAGAYGLADEPTSALASVPAGAVGGYIYAKLRKHRQGRRAVQNSWENLRGYLSGGTGNER